MADGTGPGGVVAGCWARPAIVENKAKQAKKRKPRPMRLIGCYLLRTKIHLLWQLQRSGKESAKAATKTAARPLATPDSPNDKMWVSDYTKTTSRILG